MKIEKAEKKKKLYFIAVLPDETLQNEVTKLKNHMSETYKSKNALKSPPHITLFPPFHYQVNKEDELVGALNLFCVSKLPFDISLYGFGAFKPKVIYVNVEENEHLLQLHKDLLHWLDLNINVNTKDESERKFRPHMTIASRDLSKSSFFRAWEEFKNREFTHTFLTDALTLLVHNGKDWDVLEKAPFGPSPALDI